MQKGFEDVGYRRERQERSSQPYASCRVRIPPGCLLSSSKPPRRKIIGMQLNPFRGSAPMRWHALCFGDALPRGVYSAVTGYVVVPYQAESPDPKLKITMLIKQKRQTNLSQQRTKKVAKNVQRGLAGTYHSPTAQWNMQGTFPCLLPLYREWTRLGIISPPKVSAYFAPFSINPTVSVRFCSLLDASNGLVDHANPTR